MNTILKTAAIIASFSLASCRENTNTADQQQAAQTAAAMAEADRQIGMPAIKNFQERKLMKMILELRDQEGLVCYAYITDMHGKLHMLGTCIGYGLPYSVQYTNPEKLWERGGAGSNLRNGTIAQADPNGLFMPSGLSATWVMLVDPATGAPRPVYVEQPILVSPFKLNIN